MTFICDCKQKFNDSPRGVVEYEEHLPCPALEEDN